MSWIATVIAVCLCSGSAAAAVGGQTERVTAGMRAFEVAYVRLYRGEPGMPRGVAAVRSDGRRYDVTPREFLVSDPRWSPNGQLLAYVFSSGVADQRMAVVSRAGTARRPSIRGRLSGWSRDSRSLLVVDRGAVVVAGVNGGRRVLARGNIWDAAWSPNGRWIAFVHHAYVGSGEERRISSSRLHVVRAGGGDVRLLVDGAKVSCADRIGYETYWGVLWSRDSSEVAVSRETASADGGACSGGFRVTTLDGATRTESQFVPADAWSSDGTMYASARSSLEAVHRNGTRKTIAKARGWHYAEPAWSPDGRTIVYRACRAGSNLEDCRAAAAIREAGGWRVVRSIDLWEYKGGFTVAWR